MLTYVLQRILYAVPIVVLVALVTFMLFFMVVPPEVMARRHLSAKNPTREDIQNWLEKHGYDKPLFVNLETANGGQTRYADSQFVRHLRSVFLFDFGKSDQTGEPVRDILLRHMGPSLMLMVPAFILSLFLDIALALLIAYCRGTYVDRWALVACVLLMAVPTLVYIIAGQTLFSLVLRLSPIAGWDDGLQAAKFLYLPIVLAILAGLGGSIRFYRTVMLEELTRDYVRTARAKGSRESRILFRDVLKNAMIPILTSAVMSIPFLFLGSLLLENFCGIPGLGSRLIDAINASDFAVIRSLVFLETLLFILGLVLTDVSYTLVNPRVRFEGTPLNRMVVPVLLGAGAVLAAGALVRTGVRMLHRAPDAGHLMQKPWILENLVTAGVLALGLFLLHQACKRAYWREAFRRVAQNRLALVALGVVGLYTAAGFLDSISWKDAATDLRPRSLLDRVFRRDAERRERTYSSPLALEEFTGRPARPLENGPHLLGTDSTGEDVFYLTLKGIRTALMIGLFTTLLIIPIAAGMGIAAGYFRGWVDDTVQLLATLMASIPEILLLVALMTVLDRGLPQLCFALGVTSWVGLCRLLRGETLKLRDLEYVQAAEALGITTLGILWRHVLPNVMHLILITFVLRFSALVMSEVTLSYLGIGVGPGTGSWGTMIDGARLELARDPVIWWNLASAFGAMFLLVLSFNYFGDVLRDALDPRLRER
ncbi:MAG: ABC transporter permease subunit [Planctomycetes bacterium]|nr:ABC transporter permease subunit [Planctomycetota bacterium]